MTINQIYVILKKIILKKKHLKSIKKCYFIKI